MLHKHNSINSLQRFEYLKKKENCCTTEFQKIPIFVSDVSCLGFLRLPEDNISIKLPPILCSSISKRRRINFWKTSKNWNLHVLSPYQKFWKAFLCSDAFLLTHKNNSKIDTNKNIYFESLWFKNGSNWDKFLGAETASICAWYVGCTDPLLISCKT